MTLPTNPKERKNVPMARGLLDYFPDALAAVADVSRVGNDQHNPGQEMHWEKHLSTDHADCLIRHLVDRGCLDTDGLRHTAKVAWRALALLQIELENENENENETAVFKPADRIKPGGYVKAPLNTPPDFDVVTAQPEPLDGGLLSFSLCEGCHSHVCETMGSCCHPWQHHRG
jgi:hypothetical protein